MLCIRQIPAVAAGVFFAGAASASTFHVMFESDLDLPAGSSELAILSYNSIADIVSNTPFSSVFTDLGVSDGYSTRGFTFDGSDFHVMFESDLDLPPGSSELAVLSYHSIADIVSNSAFNSVFTDLGVADGYSTTGFTFDGTDFQVMFESDLDLPPGSSELAILSYHSIADIVSNSAFGSVFTDLGVADGYSTTGFTFDGSDFHVMFESDLDLPPGSSELAILSYHSIADIVSNSAFSSVFTDLGVADGYSTTGIAFVPDARMGAVPLPSSLSLMAAAMMLLLARGTIGLRREVRGPGSSCRAFPAV